MENLNHQIFLYINSFVSLYHSLDFTMILIARYMPYIFIGLLFYLWFNKRENEALYSGYATILGIILNNIIGLFYFHPRPFMDNIGISLLSHQPETSFPSDHTTFVLSIALMLVSFKSTRIIGIISTIFALWCGIARIYCGVHYPFDIVGSIAISIISIIFINLFKYKLNKLNIFILSLWDNIIGKIYD
jgi:undecaprenyl-diphosphatase